jgi:competence protein ComFC
MQHPRVWRWIERGLALIYPDVCQLCATRAATAAEGYVCSRCQRGVRFVEPPFCQRCGLPFEGDLTVAFTCANCRDLELHFEFARSAVLAHGAVLEVIHRYKYQRALWFEPFLAGLLARKAGPELPPGGWDALVPVPLFPARERHREFNQALRLARRLGAVAGIPVHAGALRRVRPTQTQTRLSREERADNMREAFVLRRGARVDGLRCVLVDDVFTTGATTSACARVLKAAGARAVCVWTVARGL